MLKLARISEFYRQTLEADAGYAGVLTHNPLEETHRAGEFRTHWGPQVRAIACRTGRTYPTRLAVAYTVNHGSGQELFAVSFLAEVGRIAFQPGA